MSTSCNFHSKVPSTLIFPSTRQVNDTQRSLQQVQRAVARTLSERETNELNCRAIDRYAVGNLTVDSKGLLVEKGWGPWLVSYVWSDDESARRVAQVVLRTLQEAQVDMQMERPISFYVRIGWAYSFTRPYTRIAEKVQEAACFSQNQQIQQAAQQVITVYGSIDYGLRGLEELTRATRSMLNQFVGDWLLGSSQGKWTIQRKEYWTTMALLRLQDQLRKNRIWDRRNATHRDREWVLSGAWKNNEPVVQTPPESPIGSGPIFV